MSLNKVPVNRRAARINRLVERCANRAVRTLDGVLGTLRLGGRKAAYDDLSYEFLGGAQDGLRARHYDKSLRLLWKAEEHASWTSIKDLTTVERAMLDQAVRELTDEERAQRDRISSAEFRAFLDRTYSRREKEALVALLSAIGHGEAYAWLVSAELLGELRSTGAKAAVTTQVLEEAKHFIVLRELVHAFDVPVPRLSAWEYFILEQVLKSRGLEKLFGMNILIEGIALGFLGLLGHLPGLEILRLFHLDESRHTALPVNYFAEFTPSFWQRMSPFSRMKRLILLAPTVPFVFFMEEDAAELGIDVFQLAGAIIQRVSDLAQRSGFPLAIPNALLIPMLNLVVNGYCYATRTGHEFTDFTKSVPDSVLDPTYDPAAAGAMVG